jgi:hypothetical protein
LKSTAERICTLASQTMPRAARANQKQKTGVEMRRKSARKSVPVSCVSEPESSLAESKEDKIILKEGRSFEDRGNDELEDTTLNQKNTSPEDVIPSEEKDPDEVGEQEVEEHEAVTKSAGIKRKVAEEENANDVNRDLPKEESTDAYKVKKPALEGTVETTLEESI